MPDGVDSASVVWSGYSSYVAVYTGASGGPELDKQWAGLHIQGLAKAR